MNNTTDNLLEDFTTTFYNCGRLETIWKNDKEIDKLIYDKLEKRVSKESK